MAEPLTEEDAPNEDDDVTCPNCSLPKSEWSRSGKGVSVEGETYCCRGCAEDEDCTCAA